MAKTQNEYWRKREESWIKQNITDDKKLAEQVTAHYQKAIENISDDINRFYVNYARRDHISMEEAIKKVSTFDVKSFESTAKKMVEEKDFSDYANERLRAYNATMRINRLEMLKSEVASELAQATSDVEHGYQVGFTNAYQEEVKRQAGILGKHVIDTPKEKISQIVNASFHGATWSQRLWVNHDELKGALDGVLSRAMVQGLNPKTIVSTLMPLVSTTITNKRRVAERLAVTETARVQDVAQMDSFKQYGFDYCVWIAEPDACELCTDIANAHDGVYRITEVPGIPEHPSCRCSKSAYVPTKEELQKWAGAEQSAPAEQSEPLSDDELIDKYFNTYTKDSGLAHDDMLEIAKRFEAAPKSMQDMFLKYKDQEKVRYVYDTAQAAANLNGGSAAFYSPAQGNVVLNLENLRGVGAGDYQKAYDVYFHEMGHLIDNFAHPGHGKPGMLFENVSGIPHYNIAAKIDEDFDSYLQPFVDKIKVNITADSEAVKDWGFGNMYVGGQSVKFRKSGELTPASARKLAVKDALKELRSLGGAPARGDLSDMIAVPAKTAYPLGVGHKMTYMRLPGKRQTEAFAEMTSATINNPESLALIKKVLPNAYKAYEQMVEDIVKGAL